MDNQTNTALPLKRKGRFKATIVNTRFDMYNGKSPSVGIIFHVDEFFGIPKGDPDPIPRWVEWKPQWGKEIVRYFYLTKSDGSRGDFTINSLMKAIPEWDGDDLDVWNTDKFHGIKVQIEVKAETEENNGQQSEVFKVAFLNPIDWEPGFVKPTKKFGSLSGVMNKPQQSQSNQVPDMDEENIPF